MFFFVLGAWRGGGVFSLDREGGEGGRGFLVFVSFLRREGVHIALPPSSNADNFT